VEFPADLNISDAAKDLVLKILRSNPSKCLFCNFQLTKIILH
jgi:hypothetical protein